MTTLLNNIGSCMHIWLMYVFSNTLSNSFLRHNVFILFCGLAMFAFVLNIFKSLRKGF